MRALRLLVFILTTALVGCSFVYDIVQWREEILFSDGSAYVAKRLSKRWGWGVPGVKQGEIIQLRLRLEGTNLEWKSDPGSSNEPIAFDVVDGYPLLVLFGEGANNCVGRALDDFAIKVLLYTEGAWEELALEDSPLASLNKNLIEGFWQLQKSTPFVPYMDLAHKAKIEPGTSFLPLLEWLAVPGRTCRHAK